MPFRLAGPVPAPDPRPRGKRAEVRPRPLENALRRAAAARSVCRPPFDQRPGRPRPGWSLPHARNPSNLSHPGWKVGHVMTEIEAESRYLARARAALHDMYTDVISTETPEF